MPDSLLTRRNALLTAGVGGVAMAAEPAARPAAAATPRRLPDRVEDWTEEDRVHALIKQQARTDVGKVIWTIRGIIYGFKAPASPVPLVRFKGCEQQWVEPTGPSEWIRYTSLLTYYSDIDTNELIDGFTNPITGEDVVFKPNWSRLPEGSKISRKGATLNIVEDAFPDFYNERSIYDVDMKLIGDTVRYHAKVHWPEPLVRNPYNQDQAFFVKMADLQNESLTSAPAHGSGHILMPSMPNIGMNTPEMGQVLWHVEFYKVKSWDDIEPDYLEKALAEHGDEFDVNPVNDTEPSKLAQNLARLGYVKN